MYNIYAGTKNRYIHTSIHIGKSPCKASARESLEETIIVQEIHDKDGSLFS